MSIIVHKLTTHNMQDATALCNQVAFIVNGKICALDMIMSSGAVKITYLWLKNGKEQIASSALNKLFHDQLLVKLILENCLQSIHSSEATLNDIYGDYGTDVVMRLGSLILWEIKFQIKYRFYLLYGILTTLYLVALFALPET